MAPTRRQSTERGQSDTISPQDTLVSLPQLPEPLPRSHSPSIESAPSSAGRSIRQEPITSGFPITYQYLEWNTSLPATEFAALPPSVQKIADPFAWGRGRKNVTTTLACFSTFLAAYIAGAYTAGMEGMKEEFGVSSQALLGGLALFTGGFAVAPMLLAPVSEVYGRRLVFISTLGLACVCHLGTALCQSFPGLMVGRFWLGVGASTFSTMVGGVISDIYHGDGRGLPMSLFTSNAVGGTAAGPVVSAFVNRHLGWRWIHWLQLIMNVFGIIVLAVMLKETRGNVLLKRKAAALNKWLDEQEKNGAVVGVDMEEDEKKEGIVGQRKIRWRVRADESKESLATLIKVSLTRPFHLLVTEPVVFWFSMWTAFSWGTLYLFLESIPLVFKDTYHFDDVQIGMIFISIIVGSIIANILNYVLEHLARIFLPLPAHSPPDPERRLYTSCLISPLLPIGMFWCGFTSQSHIHYLVPATAIACTTIGIYSIYLAVFNYFADTYQRYASSALAAQSFCRNMMAACFPLFAESMFKGLGWAGASSVLGGVAVGLTIVPWVLVFWGPRIRARSKFAKALS